MLWEELGNLGKLLRCRFLADSERSFAFCFKNLSFHVLLLLGTFYIEDYLNQSCLDFKIKLKNLHIFSMTLK